MKDEESGSGEPAKATAPHPKHRRKASAITSGRKLFVVGHASRTEWGRRYLDLYRAHLSDLGGEEGLSEARRSLCRRAAALETELERMECRMAADMQVDLDRYGRAAGNLRRILESIGLDRRTKDVTPVSLQEYLEYRAKAEPKT